MIHWGHSFASDASLLKLLTPEGKEQIVALRGLNDLKIGTSTEANLRLEGPDIAERHCRIYKQGDRLLLVDHGSATGTLINDTRCVQPTRLREGDRIVIGDFLLIVQPGRAHSGQDAIAKKMTRQSPVWDGDDDYFIRRLSGEAAAWEARGRPSRMLLRGERLERAIALTNRPVALEQWLITSATSQIRRQGARWLAAGLLPGLLLGAVVAVPALSTAADAPPAIDPSAATPSPAPPAPPAAPASATCTPIRHTVIPDETVEQIAELYDISPARLAEDNKLGPSAVLLNGSTLDLCAYRPAIVRRHIRARATPDDTWESLAHRFRLPVDKLRRFNPNVVLGRGVLVDIWTEALEAPMPIQAVPDVPSLGVSIKGTTDGELLSPVKALSRTFELRCETTSYASRHTRQQLETALRALREGSNYRGDLIVGDLSKKTGGNYGPHLSHTSGRDVDIWLPIRGGRYRQDELDRECNHCRTFWCRPQPDEVDWDITLRMVQALVSTGEVKNIFLDRSLHPDLRDAARRAGLDTAQIDDLVQPRPGFPAAVTHADNHKQHFHVRFRCGQDEPDCVE